jgi:hypothetical protein
MANTPAIPAAPVHKADPAQQIEQATSAPAPTDAPSQGLIEWSNTVISIWLSPLPGQSEGPVDPDPVSAALDCWTRAHTRGVAREKFAQADVALGYVVNHAIMQSCKSTGNCDFASTRNAAAVVAKSARESSTKLRERGIISKVEDADRQGAVRRAAYAVLLDAAHSSLKSLADGKAGKGNRDQTIEDIASWVVDQQRSSLELKSLVEQLVKNDPVDSASKNAFIQIANDLVNACKRRGLVYNAP